MYINNLNRDEFWREMLVGFREREGSKYCRQMLMCEVLIFHKEYNFPSRGIGYV